MGDLNRRRQRTAAVAKAARTAIILPGLFGFLLFFVKDVQAAAWPVRAPVRPLQAHLVGPGWSHRFPGGAIGLAPAPTGQTAARASGARADHGSGDRPGPALEVAGLWHRFGPGGTCAGGG
jgi:hypothetical protein